MQAIMQQQHQSRPYYGDSWLIILAMLLVFVGLIMMTSASVEIGESLHRDPFYYFKRQLIFILLGLVGAIIIFQIPLLWWQKVIRFNWLSLVGTAAVWPLLYTIWWAIGLAVRLGDKWTGGGKRDEHVRNRQEVRQHLVWQHRLPGDWH